MLTHSLLGLWAAVARRALQQSEAWEAAGTVTTTRVESASVLPLLIFCTLCAFCVTMPIFVLLHETAHVAAAVAMNRLCQMAQFSVTVSLTCEATVT